MPRLPSALGSSPLTRGKLPVTTVTKARAGLIPAHAGKTPIGRSGVPVARAHPRSRGENSTAATSLWRLLGSSPLTRGKRRHDYSTRSMPGLIPAHAGKTREISPCPPSSRAHPRSRGENDHEEAVDADQDGSSPLTRGKQNEVTEAMEMSGLIPAHAGKTSSGDCRAYPAWAHPRSRGENSPETSDKDVVTGSSPLTRGKPVSASRCLARLGLIPAHAGKTLAAWS